MLLLFLSYTEVCLCFILVLKIPQVAYKKYLKPQIAASHANTAVVILYENHVHRLSSACCKHWPKAVLQKGSLHSFVGNQSVPIPSRELFKQMKSRRHSDINNALFGEGTNN